MNNTEEKTLSDLKVDELKIELDKIGLNSSGVKSVLVERLEQALKAEGRDLNTFRFTVKESSEERMTVSESDEGVLHHCFKEANDVYNESCGSGPALTIVSSESIGESADSGIVQVDDLTNKEVCSKLNIDEVCPDKLNSAKVIDFSHENVLNIAEDFSQEEKDKANEKIDNKSVESSSEMSEKRNEVQATITTEIFRDNIIEQGDVMLVEKHEQKIMTTTQVVNLPSADTQHSTSTKSSIQQNSQSNNLVATLQTTTAEATASRDLDASLWIRNITNTTKAVELKALFSKHSKVVTAKIFTTKNKLSPTCFGFVVLSDASAADLCVQKLNRMNFKGRIINVEKADRSNLSQINKSANGGATNFDNSIPLNQNNPENYASKDTVDSTSGDAKIINTLQTKTDNGDIKRSPRPRVISTSNVSSKEARNSTSNWRSSGYEKRNFVGSRSFNTRSSRINVPSYGSNRVMEIRHGRAGRRVSSRGRNLRNSSDTFSNRAHFGSNVRRSTGRSTSHRHKVNDDHNKFRRSPAGGKSNEAVASDKEELLRFMRRKEEEHRKKEDELRLEREREKIRYEREKLEREKLELETYKLQAQLAQATQLQFAAVASMPTGAAPALISSSGDSSASALHSQQFGDSGFNHRRERADIHKPFFSSERRGAELPSKNEAKRSRRSKSRSSKRNDRDDRSNRSRHSSRNKRSHETSRSLRYRNKSRSRSPLRRLEPSRRNSLTKDHQTNTRYQNENNNERESQSIYSNNRNVPINLDANNSSLSKRGGEGRSFEFDNYDNKRYFYNTDNKRSFDSDRARQIFPIGNKQIQTPQTHELNMRRDYYTGTNQYNTSGAYSGDGTLRSNPMYASRVQQRSQNTGHPQSFSTSRSADEMFGNSVFAPSSLSGGDNSILTSGYDNSQHQPQQYSSGVGTYQQGSVAGWGGQLNAGGNSTGRAAQRFGVNDSGGSGGSSTAWNSGGDWSGIIGTSARGGTSSRYNSSYNKATIGYSAGRRY